MITQVSNQSAKVSQSISSFDLMKLIFKINAQFEKTSFESFKTKRSELSIFDNQARSQSGLKGKEGLTLISLALLAVGASLSSTFAQGFYKTALETSGMILPRLSDASKSLFDSYSSIYESKKQLASIESENNKTVESSLDQTISQNQEKLSGYLRQLGSLNHLRH